MAKITPFLRRDNTNGDTEYLFLPADTLNLDFENNPINMSLPGNTADDAGADTANNFNIEIGRWELRIRMAGSLVAVSESELPALGTGNNLKYIVPDGSPTDDKPTGGYSGSDLRDALIDYATNLGKTGTYGNEKLGWPDWHSSYDNNDSNGESIDGTNYRTFEGSIRNMQTEERPSRPDNFNYSFRWIVGSK